MHMTWGAWAAGHGFLVATLLLAALATADVARAQDIVVDGETVTAYDIDQHSRIKFGSIWHGPSIRVRRQRPRLRTS